MTRFVDLPAGGQIARSVTFRRPPHQTRQGCLILTLGQMTYENYGRFVDVGPERER